VPLDAKTAKGTVRAPLGREARDGTALNTAAEATGHSGPGHRTTELQLQTRPVDVDRRPDGSLFAFRAIPAQPQLHSAAASQNRAPTARIRCQLLLQTDKKVDVKVELPRTTVSHDNDDHDHDHDARSRR